MLISIASINGTVTQIDNEIQSIEVNLVSLLKYCKGQLLGESRVSMPRDRGSRETL